MTSILCTGDRKYTDTKSIEVVFGTISNTLTPNTCVVYHGDCTGADKLCASAASAHGMNVVAYPAEWHKYGPGAGPIRNRAMVDMRPDIILIWHNDLAHSRGTRHCVGYILQCMSQCAADCSTLCATTIPTLHLDGVCTQCTKWTPILLHNGVLTTPAQLQTALK